MPSEFQLLKSFGMKEEPKAVKKDTSLEPFSCQNLNLFKRRGLGESHTAVRVGYNGMGSHGRHVAPMPRPSNLNVPKKGLSKVMKNPKKAPPLPSMDAFLSLG